MAALQMGVHSGNFGKNVLQLAGINIAAAFDFRDLISGGRKSFSIQPPAGMPIKPEPVRICSLNK